MSKYDEIIIVVPRKELFEDELFTFQGTESRQKYVTWLMNNINNHYTTMRRGSRDEKDVPVSQNAELNFDYKQPIPYIVIRRGNQFFVTERLKGGGEARLHGKLSMGAGGHMNPLDKRYPFSKLLEVNTQRELEEELEITGEIKIKPIGLINDDSDEVGRVHIGILGIIDLKESDEVRVRETDQLAGYWMTLEDLRKEDIYNRLENWSKIVVDIM